MGSRGGSGEYKRQVQETGEAPRPARCAHKPHKQLEFERLQQRQQQQQQQRQQQQHQKAEYERRRQREQQRQQQTKTYNSFAARSLPSPLYTSPSPRD